jgi:hypothetical protein
MKLEKIKEGLELFTLVSIFLISLVGVNPGV